MGFSSPLLSPHTSPFSLSPRYCTLVLFLGVVHDLVGHRHQANAFLQTPPATERHKLSQQPRRACHGPAESAAGCHPQILLQTKMVSSILDLGVFRCQEAQMRLSAPSHHVEQIPAPLRVLGSPGSPHPDYSFCRSRCEGAPSCHARAILAVSSRWPNITTHT